jgi:phytoene dehydrogenase-like protein
MPVVAEPFFHLNPTSPPPRTRIPRPTPAQGGNIFQASMGLDQLFWSRPLPGWARYRAPVAGLYMASAGTHPGGGVIGAPGANCAGAVLQDLGAGPLR